MASIRCWASAMSTCGRHDFLHRLPCTQAITPACTYTHTRACTYAQHTHSCTQTDQLMRLRSCEGVSTQIGLRSRPISNFASFPYPPPLCLFLSIHYRQYAENHNAENSLARKGSLSALLRSSRGPPTACTPVHTMPPLASNHGATHPPATEIVFAHLYGTVEQAR